MKNITFGRRLTQKEILRPFVEFKDNIMNDIVGNKKNYQGKFTQPLWKRRGKSKYQSI